MDGERIFGIIMCIAATIGMIMGWIKIFEDTQKFQWGRDFWHTAGLFCIFFAVWYSLPLAWARGMFFDPTLIIFGALGTAMSIISGCVESKDAYLKRTGRKR